LLELARVRDAAGDTARAQSAREAGRALLVGVEVPDELAPYVHD
jgi:hypothetical protein